jgi:CheY-like chemotaxis protein/glycine cleavage system H lipoate-binding protein
MKIARDILVIDDEPVVLQGVARICGSEGLTVDTAPSGQAGLERLEKSAYRLIICDIMMGDIDGFEFLAAVGRRGDRTPVVMATGNSTVQNAVRSLQHGAIDYLAKPFTVDELMAVINRGLNYRAMHDRGSAAPSAPRSCPVHFHRLGYVSWAVTEPVGTVLIGVNDLFVKTLSGFRSIELVAEGTDLVQGTGCATITSSDGLAHALMCPVSGRVIEVHAELQAQPAQIERDPYGAGWLYRILPSDLAYDLQNLTAGSDSQAEQNFPQQGASS